MWRGKADRIKYRKRARHTVRRPLLLCGSKDQSDLVFFLQKSRRDVVPGQFLSVQDQLPAAGLFSIRVFHKNVQNVSPKFFFYFQFVPAFGNGGGYCDAPYIGAKSEDSLHAAHHDRGRGSGEPVHMGAPKMLTGFPLRELSVTVGLQMADVCPVILSGGSVFHKVSKCSFAVFGQSFGEDQPALGLGEDAGVFLCPGIVDTQFSAKKYKNS